MVYLCVFMLLCMCTCVYMLVCVCGFMASAIAICMEGGESKDITGIISQTHCRLYKPALYSNHNCGHLIASCMQCCENNWLAKHQLFYHISVHLVSTQTMVQERVCKLVLITDISLLSSMITKKVDVC